jgi:Na+:H+ antiporter, NhaA family
MKTKLTQLFIDFIRSEQSSGALLILGSTIALVIANSAGGDEFHAFWKMEIGFDSGVVHLKHSIEHWVNDGLMAIFFLLIGLEIEREIYIGELSDLKNSTLPIFAALGGMAMPALIHYGLNRGTLTQSGFGIPMATDIAFSLGTLAVLGSRAPVSLKIFLTALAIIDDLGAIIVITIFYAGRFVPIYLLLALGILVLLLVLNRLKVNTLAAYLLPGLLIWYLVFQSGIHAAVAGVLLAFVVPFRDGNANSPSYRLQRILHEPVAFIIMPLFALANTGIALSQSSIQSLVNPNTVGIFAGLLIGKPLGIVLFSLAAIGTRLSKLPASMGIRHLIGGGLLGGIGFTMSIFITILAFGDTQTAQSSKIAVMAGSLAAGILGLILLGWRSGAVAPVADKE